ncbi:MAG: DUF4405 domain-containing protein [Spirochaetales bacterium]|nr:DUF4405 domain-containing protein [Spirochaetales bacterium]MDY5915279.1 DUF4405 domain-containing protein [Treponema sp.]
MTKTQRLRMSIDITMTILSIILMGGNYLFPADLVHEILGVGLFVLWGVHIALNRRWYSAIFRGKYKLYRVMQTVINCCILICTIFLMISGIILSNHFFTFLNIQSGLGFARIAHLLSSHWYYLFMSLHIGLHIGRLFQNIVAKILPRILLALTCLYGLYAFIARGVWKYLILKQQFFFFDLERGYILFAMDYISIIILFAVVSRLVAAILKR